MLQDKNQNSTPISQIGEFGLIHRIEQAVEIQQELTETGIGDDAAILDLKDKKTVISTDLLAEGIDFNLGYVPLKHLGYKAIAAGLSDICAMNAEPTQVLVSIAVSDRFPVEAIDELYAGILTACKNYKVDLVGGDTSASHSGLIINVTAVGVAKSEDLTYRNGAKEGNLLVVSGDLGAAYFGLQILERENEVWKVNPNVQPDLSAYNYLLGRQLKPEARIDIVQLLKNLEVKPTAMIDISDGLSSEILHLSEQSNVGFNLYEDKIPLDQQVIHAGEEFEINAAIAALNGGEDYELLFTIDTKDYDKIKANPNFSIIGHAVEKSKGNHLVARGSEQLIPLSSRGWDAFLAYKNQEDES